MCRSCLMLLCLRNSWVIVLNEWCGEGLLLLLFLLDKLCFAVIKGLKNIRVEQRLADVVQFDLDLVQIIVQPDIENFFDGAKLEFRREPAAEFFSFVGKAAFGNARD